MEEVLSRSSRGYHSLSDQLFPLQLNPTRYHCDTTPPVGSKSRVERETRREWLVTLSHTTRSEREREGTKEQRARVRLTQAQQQEEKSLPLRSTPALPSPLVR